MNPESEDTALNTMQKPQIFLKSIEFNDGTQLILKRNSIIVFTGANNSGKSQVLKDIEQCMDENNKKPTIVLKNYEFEYCGAIDEETFLQEHFHVNEKGLQQQIESGTSFDMNTLKLWWKDHTFYSGLHMSFIKRLSTELRLTASNTLKRSGQAERNPICKLYKNGLLAKTLSNYFHQAFGVDLIVNRREMETIPLHIGMVTDESKFTLDRQDEYYKQVEVLPKLQEQGDGMRSFASILLDTFTSEYTITLIDEPEAFLHPPQARLLGKMLAKNNPENRQLLIATHSEDFLQGLLDADCKNITVIRINRIKNVNEISILQNNEIIKFWGNPMLRYSNILSGLFHEKVVVCESDYDCLFYQAIMDAIYEQKNEISPDVLFTHCGGKDRIKDVVSALIAVNVPVVAICDFDLLDSKQTFKAIAESFGINWNTGLDASMKIIYDFMNTQKSIGKLSWPEIKKIGKAGFNGAAPEVYEIVEEVCQSVGLFIVPVGEMECFDKTINKEKKDWVYTVLEKYALAVEPKLDGARQFVQAVVDYKSSKNNEGIKGQ